jgi:hypothetical protein
LQRKVEIRGCGHETENARLRFLRMKRHLCDYVLKFILLFFIFARFLSPAAPESHAAGSAKPAQEPSTDSQADS